MNKKNILNPEDDDDDEYDLSIQSSLNVISNNQKLRINAKEFIPTIQINEPPPISSIENTYYGDKINDNYTNNFIKDTMEMKNNNLCQNIVNSEFIEDEIPDNIDDLVFEALYSDYIINNKPKKEVCRYFLQGNCKYGNKCIRSHDTQEKIISFEEDVALSRDIHCAICDEDIVGSGKRFGLLVGIILFYNRM